MPLCKEESFKKAKRNRGKSGFFSFITGMPLLAAKNEIINIHWLLFFPLHYATSLPIISPYSMQRQGKCAFFIDRRFIFRYNSKTKCIRSSVG